MASLLRRGFSIGLKLILGGLFGLQAASHDSIQPGLNVGRYEHLGYGDIVYNQTEVGGEFVDAVVDAVAQLITRRADHCVVEVAITDTDLHGLAGAVLNASLRSFIVEI